MTAYYVGGVGTPNGNGTIGSPFATFASVPSLVAGDDVLFACSAEHDPILYDASRGAASTLANPITFKSYGTGAKPRVRGSGWCIDIQRAGVVVRDLQCGALGSYCDGGVRALTVGEFTALNVTTEDRCNYGISVDNAGSSLLRNINVLYCEVQGTFNDTCIRVIWGTSVGGIFEDVTVVGNSATRAGVRSTILSNTPQGIRFLSRTVPLTTSNGTVDRDLFSRGVVCEYNRVTDIPAYGITYAAIGSGGTETQRNRLCNNTLKNIGDGRYDTHMLWVAGVRDVLVGWNDIDGSTMFQGSTFGTGVGIFIDNYGFDNLYDNAKRVTVRGNKVRNCGRRAEGSLNTMEVAGAGILVFLAQDIQVIGNDTEGCYNGIAVMGWFGGSSGKSANVVVRGNKAIRSARDAFVVCKGADNVDLTENYAAEFGAAGLYVETHGSMAVTNYTEARNNVVGGAATAYMGGSEPTSVATPRARRTPAAWNLALSERWL